MFSSLKTRKPKRYGPKLTTGSGKSKLNFMYPFPRGGMNTSLVEARSLIAPSGSGGWVRRDGGPGGGRSGPSALAAPTARIHSRRLSGSGRGGSSRRDGKPRRSAADDLPIHRVSLVEEPVERRQGVVGGLPRGAELERAALHRRDPVRRIVRLRGQHRHRGRIGVFEIRHGARRGQIGRASC